MRDGNSEGTDALDFNVGKFSPWSICLGRPRPPEALIPTGSPVALYVRYSDRSSRARQARTLRRYARSQGLKIVGNYADTESDRPSLAELRKCAASGSITAIVVESVDRLSRNFSALLELAVELGKHSVRILTPEDLIRRTRRAKRSRRKSVRAANRKPASHGGRSGRR
jgi:hypothetical protein